MQSLSASYMSADLKVLAAEAVIKEENAALHSRLATHVRTSDQCSSGGRGDLLVNSEVAVESGPVVAKGTWAKTFPTAR